MKKIKYILSIVLFTLMITTFRTRDVFSLSEKYYEGKYYDLIVVIEDDKTHFEIIHKEMADVSLDNVELVINEARYQMGSKSNSVTLDHYSNTFSVVSELSIINEGIITKRYQVDSFDFDFDLNIFEMVKSVTLNKANDSLKSHIKVIKDSNLIVKTDYARNQNHPNYHPSWYWTNYSYGKLYINGEVVFCIDMESPIADGNGYSNMLEYETLTQYQKDRITKIALVGYGYENNTSDNMWWATQSMIWETMGWSTSNSKLLANGKNIDVSKEISLIQKRIDSLHLKPKWNDSILYANASGMVVIDNAILSEYELSNYEGFEIVEKEQSKIVLKLNKNTYKSTLEFKKKLSRVSGNSIVYSKPGNQSVFLVRNSLNLGARINVEMPKGELEVLKQDDEGKPIEGVSFELTNKENNLKFKGITDKEGRILIKDIPIGHYELKEIGVPSPYVVSKETYDIIIQSDTQFSISIINEKARGQIIINKSSENGSLIAGVIFEIYDSKGVLQDTLQTNDEGVAISKLLDLGKYSLKEVYTPEPFVLLEDVIEVNILYKDMNTPVVFTNIDVSNSFQRHDIVIEKIEDDWDKLFPEMNHIPIPNTEFELYAQEAIYQGDMLIYDSGERVYHGITDNQGKLVIKNIPIGKYKLVESKANSLYQPLSKEFIVDLGFDESNPNKENVETHIEIENRVKQGKSQIHKVNELGENLGCAHFGLYNEHDVLLFEGFTNAHGYLESPMLRFGQKYYWKEINAPAGYDINDSKYEFNVEDEDIVFEIECINVALKSSIRLIKKDAASSKPLDGFEFTLTNVSSGVSHDGKTDKNGVIEFNELPFGTYVIKETSVNGEYILSENDKKIVVDEGNKVYEIVIYNKQPTLDIGLIKKDRTSSMPIEGVTFGLYRVALNTTQKSFETMLNEGNIKPLKISKTNYQGEILFSSLDWNYDYFLVELEPAYGYEKSSLIQKVSKKYQGANTPKVSELYEFYNSKERIVIKTVKIDSNSGRIIKSSTLKFSLTDSSGKIIEPKLITSSGEHIWEVEALSIYHIEEINPPTGYSPLKDTITVNTNTYPDSLEIVLEIENDPIDSILVSTGIGSNSTMFLAGLLVVSYGFYFFFKR